jgi:hypothetical protein
LGQRQRDPMSPSSFLITVSGILLIIAYGLYVVTIIVGPSSIDVEKLLIPSSVVQSFACAIAILLEREFRRYVRDLHIIMTRRYQSIYGLGLCSAYGTEQQNTIQHLAVATILTASSVGVCT